MKLCPQFGSNIHFSPLLRKYYGRKGAKDIEKAFLLFDGDLSDAEIRKQVPENRRRPHHLFQLPSHVTLYVRPFRFRRAGFAQQVRDNRRTCWERVKEALTGRLRKAILLEVNFRIFEKRTPETRRTVLLKSHGQQWHIIDLAAPDSPLQRKNRVNGTLPSIEDALNAIFKFVQNFNPATYDGTEGRNEAGIWHQKSIPETYFQQGGESVAE